MPELLVKMPFARSNKTGKIIGIEQVERGDKCDCRCLCCNTPVTARQANINQWHFSHRVNENSTATECRFSPVTAIALIIRQQLSELRSFNLNGWDFDVPEWEIDVLKNGVRVDAYALDPTTMRTAIIEIPFANDQGNDLNECSTEFDLILRIDTHAMSRDLYSKTTPNVLYRAEEIFEQLLEHWEDWVTVERGPDLELPTEQIEDSTCTDQANIAREDIDNTPAHSSDQSLCARCGLRVGIYGKGLLCKPCVNEEVGQRFLNLTEMKRYYQQHC